MVWATSLILAAAAASSSAPVGLGQFTLGMSIEEMKVVPVRQGYTNDKIYISCSTDKHPSIGATPDNAERAAGVEICIPSAFNGPTTLYIGEDIAAQARFMFFEGKLYEINSFFKKRNNQTIMDAMLAKFGKPTETTNGTIQNRMAAQFEQITAVWKLGEAEIVFQSPAGRIDETFLTFRAEPTATAVNERIRAEKAKATGF